MNWNLAYIVLQTPTLAAGSESAHLKVGFYLADHVYALCRSGNFKAPGFLLSAGSPVTVIVTFL